MTVDSAVSEMLAEELADTEADLIAAISDGTTYRQLLLMALGMLESEQRIRQRIERRMAEFLGTVPMHPEQEQV